MTRTKLEAITSKSEEIDKMLKKNQSKRRQRKETEQVTNGESTKFTKLDARFKPRYIIVKGKN